MFLLWNEESGKELLHFLFPRVNFLLKKSGRLLFFVGRRRSSNRDSEGRVAGGGGGGRAGKENKRISWRSWRRVVS